MNLPMAVSLDQIRWKCAERKYAEIELPRAGNGMKKAGANNQDRPRVKPRPSSFSGMR